MQRAILLCMSRRLMQTATVCDSTSQLINRTFRKRGYKHKQDLDYISELERAVMYKNSTTRGSESYHKAETSTKLCHVMCTRILKADIMRQAKDSHMEVEACHKLTDSQVEKPIAAALQDLK